MKRIAPLIAGVALMLPGTALASGSSSTCQSYNPQLCSVSGNAGAVQATTTSTTPTTSTSGTSTSQSGTLPFTGLDVGLLAVGGGGLLGAGLLVRRLSGNAGR